MKNNRSKFENRRFVPPSHCDQPNPQREESIAKRRNFQPIGGEDELDSDEDVEVGTQALSDTLPAMLQAVYSDNQDTQLEATMKFRKYVVYLYPEVALNNQTVVEREESTYRPCD